jgi:hypothetical protein
MIKEDVCTEGKVLEIAHRRGWKPVLKWPFETPPYKKHHTPRLHLMNVITTRHYG